MNKPEKNPELDRVKELVRFNGPWGSINDRLKVVVRRTIRNTYIRKKVFVVQRYGSRFVAVANSQAEAEAQIS